MSRRESRESELKRHRSRFDREPSPKRSRRVGKPVTERKPRKYDLDSGDHADRDQKHRRRLQDALPLEATLAPDSSVGNGPVFKDTEKKTNGRNEGTKNSSDPTEIPRSRSYFQHDERGSAGQAGRSFGHRATAERGWWRDLKDQNDTSVASKSGNHENQQREEKAQAPGDVWRHDGFFEMEANPPPPPVRKRPAFREQKIPIEAENADKAATAEPVKSSNPDRPFLGSERREEREGRYSRRFDRSERPPGRDRVPPKKREADGSFPSRERYGGGGGEGGGGGGGGNYRGRDRFNGRQGFRSSGTRVEKWKHDLFDDANRSPTPKNEEDQIAKVEALLAS